MGNFEDFLQRIHTEFAGAQFNNNTDPEWMGEHGKQLRKLMGNHYPVRHVQAPIDLIKEVSMYANICILPQCNTITTQLLVQQHLFSGS